MMRKRQNAKDMKMQNIIFMKMQTFSCLLHENSMLCQIFSLCCTFRKNFLCLTLSYITSRMDKVSCTQCPLSYCRRCLHLYGIVSSSLEREAWVCPKCIHVCKCGPCAENSITPMVTEMQEEIIEMTTELDDPETRKKLQFYPVPVETEDGKEYPSKE